MESLALHARCRLQNGVQHVAANPCRTDRKPGRTRDDSGRIACSCRCPWRRRFRNSVTRCAVNFLPSEAEMASGFAAVRARDEYWLCCRPRRDEYGFAAVRDEMDSGLAAVRAEMDSGLVPSATRRSSGFAAVRRRVRTVNDETRRHMQMLHEDVIAKIALTQEGSNGRKRPAPRGRGRKGMLCGRGWIVRARHGPSLVRDLMARLALIQEARRPRAKRR